MKSVTVEMLTLVLKIVAFQQIQIPAKKILASALLELKGVMFVAQAKVGYSVTDSLCS